MMRAYLIRQNSVAQTKSNVPQNGGITKVSLISGNWKFVEEMVQEGAANAKISLGIFKINRVDFMRHGT